MLKKLLTASFFVLITTIGCRAEAAMITAGIAIDLNNGYQCVEVAGGFTTEGTKVQSWDCWGGFNQQWQVYDGQILGIGSEINGQGPTSNLTCMDIAGTVAGSGVVLNKCTGASTQHWGIANGRIFPLDSRFNNLCLDVGKGFSISGVQVTVQACNNSLSQRFAIR